MTKEVENYSIDFKMEAIKKFEDINSNLSITAQQLDLRTQTLSNWQKNTMRISLKL